MSDHGLEYELSPAGHKHTFLGFWRIATVSALLLVGLALFLFFATVAGQMLTGLVLLVISIIAAIAAALRL